MCCNDEPNLVAHWVFKAQTACYARQRAQALRYLGTHYKCVCVPYILCVFVQGTNDTDEYVRRQAIREIIRQTRRYPACCNGQIVAALTAALADCDKGVARLAEKALCQCGYDVQAAVACAACGPSGCGPWSPPAPAPLPMPVPSQMISPPVQSPGSGPTTAYESAPEFPGPPADSEIR